MYKIETSEGDIYFDAVLEHKLYTISDITFLDDGSDKLKKLYRFNNLHIISAGNKHFLQIYLDDDHYGNPEYRIISREEEQQVDELKAKIVRLKEKIKYSPGKKGFVEAKEHFESLMSQQ